MNEDPLRSEPLVEIQVRCLGEMAKIQVPQSLVKKLHDRMVIPVANVLAHSSLEALERAVARGDLMYIPGTNLIAYVWGLDEVWT